MASGGLATCGETMADGDLAACNEFKTCCEL